MGTWKVGVAKRKITPEKPFRLAGYSMRSPSEGILQDIYAKALIIEDERGNDFVLVNADLVGFERAFIERVANTVKKRFGLPRERLVINASHNHSGPVTCGVLPTYYSLDSKEEKHVHRYSEWLFHQIIDGIGEAKQSLTSVELSFGQGLAGFGVNRRRARGNTRHLSGVVDQDVPVLSASTLDGELLAIVFGYACHATTASDNLLHGDYPGCAQSELERRHPGATAFFVTGCAGDIDPMPRLHEGLIQAYGSLLATAVDDVLQREMSPISGVIEAACDEVPLRLEPRPSHAKLQSLVDEQAEISLGMRRVFEAELKKTDDEIEGELPDCAYTIQTWRIGKCLTFIWLAGEPVVDYSLRFKARYGWETTWVSGYCNDLLSYIPSERVLAEGGYEGGDAHLEYGLLAPFAKGIEATIVDCVERQVTRSILHGPRS